ncbi:hypothetical protein PR048_031674 [Dryococelus australis]|uniref:Uncharacterized protein n=1 Tax=Dryococelus australis TaxID=614101 RepID=A0ABQ9G9Z3_9NEOP|nr:hypothetical protein PR048_031674 [Dryococelus australis]
MPAVANKPAGQRQPMAYASGRKQTRWPEATDGLCQRSQTNPLARGNRWPMPAVANKPAGQRQPMAYASGRKQTRWPEATDGLCQRSQTTNNDMYNKNSFESCHTWLFGGFGMVGSASAELQVATGASSIGGSLFYTRLHKLAEDTRTAGGAAEEAEKRTTCVPVTLEDWRQEILQFITGAVINSQHLGALCKKTFNNWKKAIKVFDRHSAHQYHQNCLQDVDWFLSVNRNPDKSVENQLDSEKHRIAVETRKRLILAIETQELVLRGSKDDGRLSAELPEHKDGNFRAILRYRANYCNSQQTCYQSEQIKVFFSGLYDETSDVSEVDQASLCIRHVESGDGDFRFREDFLQFIPYKFNILGDKDTMEPHLLSVSHPTALYVHCSSHAFNLAVSKSCESQAIRDCLGIIAAAHTMFVYPKRKAVLVNYTENFDVSPTEKNFERLCVTRTKCTRVAPNNRLISAVLSRTTLASDETTCKFPPLAPVMPQLARQWAEHVPTFRGKSKETTGESSGLGIGVQNVALRVSDKYSRKTDFARIISIGPCKNPSRYYLLIVSEVPGFCVYTCRVRSIQHGPNKAGVTIPRRIRHDEISVAANENQGHCDVNPTKLRPRQPENRNFGTLGGKENVEAHYDSPWHNEDKTILLSELAPVDRFRENATQMFRRCGVALEGRQEISYPFHPTWMYSDM